MYILERILDVIVQYVLEDQHRYRGTVCLESMSTSLRQVSSFRENPRRARQHPLTELRLRDSTDTEVSYAWKACPIRCVVLAPSKEIPVGLDSIRSQNCGSMSAPTQRCRMLREHVHVVAVS